MESKGLIANIPLQYLLILFNTSASTAKGKISTVIIPNRHPPFAFCFFDLDLLFFPTHIFPRFLSKIANADFLRDSTKPFVISLINILFRTLDKIIPLNENTVSLIFAPGATIMWFAIIVV